jgi:hypothetical protein
MNNGGSPFQLEPIRQFGGPDAALADRTRRTLLQVVQPFSSCGPDARLRSPNHPRHERRERKFKQSTHRRGSTLCRPIDLDYSGIIRMKPVVELTGFEPLTPTSEPVDAWRSSPAS